MEPFAPTPARPDAPAPRPHVVLLASPGAGHLIPLAELARRLVKHHGVAATLVTFADLDAPDARSAVLSSLPASVATAVLPALPLDDLPADTPLETLLIELVHRCLPHLREMLRSIRLLAALVPDFFCSAALSVADELGVPGYIFFPSSLAAMSVMSRTVELHDGAATGEYRALPDPLELPGGVSLRNAEVPDAFRDSTLPVYGHLVETGRQYRRAAGILVNTFTELEPAAAEDSKKVAEKGSFPPAYPVGPFVRSSSDEASESACLEWLDLQPPLSVVYVSFGSAGMLSVEQTRELAAGLEMSGHRFLWIVRMPSLNGETFALHNGEDGRSHGEDPLAWLPDGFLERTSSRGLAVAAWAPQVRVLSHPATAAFVSHCGWNSTLESVAAGVPVIAWPLHAEQKMNAVVLEESVGVALRPRAREEEEDDAGGALVTRGEIAAAVKELMDGEKGRVVRRRARDMEQVAGRVWSPEGSSRRALEEVAAKWKAMVAHK
ncbi:hydroquinone glucosyltransferase-like [Oryza brachyantha]|uniref:hydroquinone glucosyltransferase-like n=1 Tax=Oryza brachyantha TaxID=4533 RepID=UPI001ADAFE0E|nr:hydroquinone glucosyltransferase-like [Oryza brachyantha]